MGVGEADAQGVSPADQADRERRQNELTGVVYYCMVNVSFFGTEWLTIELIFVLVVGFFEVSESG